VYGLLADSQKFKEGIERLLTLPQSQRVALVCAEREPLECHRTILIGKVLHSKGTDVVSILGDGSAELWPDLVTRLLRLRKLDRPSLFESEDELVQRAFLEQEREIAYAPDTAGVTSG